MFRWFFTVIALGVVLTFAMVGCGGDDDDSDATTAPSGDADVTVEVVLLDTMSFEPSSITVAPGETVEVIVSNEGALPHNFSIEGLDVSVDVSGGDTESVIFTAPTSPGEHKIFCDVVGHEGAGMVGAFIVEE